VESSGFDAGYFDRFYFNARTQVAAPEFYDRQAAFIGAYLNLLDCRVRRVLDVGCGVGWLHRGLRRAFRGVRIDACDASEYVCRRYGWTHAKVEALPFKDPYDLVICHDVLQYLARDPARRALERLIALSRTALLFGVLTREDWNDNCDQRLTDARAHLRSAAWYRRILAPRMHNIGGGLYLRRDAGVVVYALEAS
jgi:SAM-dependent methyltransferase